MLLRLWVNSSCTIWHVKLNTVLHFHYWTNHNALILFYTKHWSNAAKKSTMTMRIFQHADSCIKVAQSQMQMISNICNKIRRSHHFPPFLSLLHSCISLLECSNCSLKPLIPSCIAGFFVSVIIHFVTWIHWKGWKSKSSVSFQYRS